MPGDWTPERLPRLDGRTVVVTGANSGIGKAATGAFARAGADVVMACRSPDRGEAAREDLLVDDLAGSLSVGECDLADLDSVAGFADRLLAERDSLSVLCNNAGVMAIPRRETVDGFEYQFGVNHLGHFALTGRLLGRLVETADESRVVTQSSMVHRRGRVDFGDLHGEVSYHKRGAYNQSKLANLLFAFELQRRLESAGVDGVLSVGCNPGYVATNLQRRGPEAEGSTLRLWAMELANALFAMPAERGAWPMLYAATADAIEGGEYVAPAGPFGARGATTAREPSPRARDEATAARLWRVSEELTGVAFDL